MSRRARVLKKLLFGLLLTASLLLAPLLIWAGSPLLQFVFASERDPSSQAEESFEDDIEAEAYLEQARTKARARLRAHRVKRVATQKIETVSRTRRDARFAIVVDVRRVKPQRLFAPPYLRPRVVRLLS